MSISRVYGNNFVKFGLESSQNKFDRPRIQESKANLIPVDSILLNSNHYVPYLNTQKLKKIAPEHSGLIDQLKKENIIKLLNKSDIRHIKDFLNVCSKLGEKNQKILTSENLQVLAKVMSGLQGKDLLLNHALNINNGKWLSKILQNQYFSEEDKINAIKPDCISGANCKNIIKNENLFYNASPEGNILAELNDHHNKSEVSSGQFETAAGLFTNDTQFVSNYKVTAFDEARKAPIALKLTGSENFDYGARYSLRNENQDLEISREQLINKGFFEKISAKNNSDREKTIRIDLTSCINDLFQVRGRECTEKYPEFRQTVDEDGNIILNTKINDNKDLGVKISIKSNNGSVKINYKKDNSLISEIILPPNSGQNIIDVHIQPIISEKDKLILNKPFVNGKAVESSSLFSSNDISSAFNDKANFSRIEMKGEGVFKEDAGKILKRAFGDISLLTNILSVNGKDHKYIGAGLPLYNALFGRDSIITAKFLLPFNPEIAKGTLTLLAEYQGKSIEDRLKEEKQKNPDIDEKEFKAYYKAKEESEGKILHELRVGELANQKKILYTPYYGTIDATPLWLILVSDYYKWTGDRETVNKLLPNIERALDWINRNSKDEANPEIDGFLKFKPAEGTDLPTQNWKDTRLGESTKHNIGKDGKLAFPEFPISFSEVQGYVYEAKKGVAQLYRGLGNIKKSEKLDSEADKFKEKFNEKFWCEDINFIAMALDGKGNPVKSIASNGSQCLATGIVDKDKVQAIEKITMSDALNSGWGIRTLAKSSPAFDEKSYHNGSVWPHDTAMIAQGLSKNNAAILAKNMLEALATLPDKRVPELMAGFDRKEGDKIDLYPDACSPQAWASAGIINMPLSHLGIKLANNNLVLDNPVLPEGLDKIKIKDIKIKGNKLDLDISRITGNKLKVEASSQGKPLIVKELQEQNAYIIDY